MDKHVTNYALARIRAYPRVFRDSLGYLKILGIKFALQKYLIEASAQQIQIKCVHLKKKQTFRWKYASISTSFIYSSISFNALLKVTPDAHHITQSVDIR